MSWLGAYLGSAHCSYHGRPNGHLSPPRGRIACFGAIGQFRQRRRCRRRRLQLGKFVIVLGLVSWKTKWTIQHTMSNL